MVYTQSLTTALSIHPYLHLEGHLGELALLLSGRSSLLLEDKWYGSIGIHASTYAGDT